MNPLRRNEFGALEDAGRGHASRQPGPLPGEPHVRLVDLVVDVFARVHVEASVEEGAVPQGLVRVLL